MDTWMLGLYAVATLLALKSLVSLMSHHRQVYRKRRTTERAVESLKSTAEAAASEKDSSDLAA